MATKRKSIKQPTIPTPSTPSWYGQNFPTPDNPTDKLGLDWLGQVGKNNNFGGNASGGGAISIKDPKVANPVTSNNMNDRDDNWADILKHNAGDNGFMQWLASQGFGNSDPNDSFAHDFNSWLMQKMVEYQQLQENRAYDRSLQLDQRVYDSPTNQLARLMGAGISRDAAIQLLGGSGSGGSAGVPYSQPFGESAGPLNSESKLRDVQAGTAIAGTLFNGISALCGLTSLGLSVPQSMMQIDMMSNQRFMSNQQRQAYEAASGAFSVLNSAGVENAAEVFGSVGKTIETLQGLASSGNAAAAAFIHNGGVQMLQQTSPYSSPMLAQMYQNERQAGDYALNFDQQIGLMRSNEELNKVNADNVRQQTVNLQQEYENLIQTEEYIKASTLLQKASAKYQDELVKSEPWRRKSLRASAARDNAQASYFNSLKTGVDLENNVMRQLQNSHTADGKSGLQWLTDATLNRLMNDCAELNYARNNKEYQHRIDKLIADEDCANSLYCLQKWYYDGTLEFLENHGSDLNENGVSMKDLIYLSRAFDNNGVFNYINTIVNAETSGFEYESYSTSSGVGPFSVSSSTTTSKKTASKGATGMLYGNKRKKR